MPHEYSDYVNFIIPDNTVRGAFDEVYGAGNFRVGMSFMLSARDIRKLEEVLGYSLNVKFEVQRLWVVEPMPLPG